MNKYIEDTDAIKRWGVEDVNGNYNSCVLIQGYDKPLRGRSEMLIIKGKSLFIQLKDNDEYRLPGGTWNKNENSKDAAIRETQEEVKLNVKNVKYKGRYSEIGNVPDWVRDSIDKKDWWYGYYTEVFVGEYDGKYHGYIADEDKDDMYKKGKFYPINLIYDRLKPIHKRILTDIIIKEN